MFWELCWELFFGGLYGGPSEMPNLSRGFPDAVAERFPAGLTGGRAAGAAEAPAGSVESIRREA